jgi:uncharacterized lipoprotein YajG
MKKYIGLLVGIALFAACEQKETTVTNPPSEKTEKKETNTTEKTETNINLNTSPTP